MTADIPGPPRKLAVRYGFIYAALAGLWVLSSDSLLATLFAEAADINRAGTLKGLGFVAVTALLLVHALNRYARVYHRSETDRALLAKRLDTLAKYANDSIVLMDAGGRFLDVNDRFLATFGYPRHEALRLSLEDWRPAYLDAGGPGLLQRLLAEGSTVVETEGRKRSGSTIPVEISAAVIAADGERVIQVIVRDVSERREAEAKILALSRLYAATSAATQAMMRAHSIKEVLDSVCRACVEYGGLRMAWVGLVEASGQRILPHASYGEGVGYLEGLAVPIADNSPLSRGPVAVAFREQRVYVCNDFMEDPATAPWHQRAAFHGFRASIALALRRGGACVGTLTAYSANRDCFDDDAVALLQDLAESISFAMDNFDRGERRLRAEAALRLSEARLNEAQAIGDIGDWFCDLGAQSINWSLQMYRLFERKPESGPPRREELTMYLDAETEVLVREAMRRAARTGERVEFEYSARLPSGRQRHHASVIVPVRDKAGAVVGLQGTVQDITARKEVEMRLRHNEAQLEEAQQVAHMGSWEWLAEVGCATWSQTMYRILGFDPGSPVPDCDVLLSMLAPESRVAVSAAAEQALRSGVSYEVDLEVFCADGTRKWLTCRGDARRQGGHIIGLYGTVQDVTARRRLEAERVERQRHLHELSRRLIAAQEDERRRLAAELHDRTSPNLAAVQVTLRSLRLSMPPEVLESLADEFDDLRALLQDATTSIRDVCADLRPALLDYAGLIPALESHIQQFSRRTGILVKLVHRGLDERLPGETEALLFRIAQEALTNCAKHAQATTVSIALRGRDGSTALSIADDGVGFDPGQVGSGGSKPGLGLLTMRERAEFAGGEMRIESAPGRGTMVRVRL